MLYDTKKAGRHFLADRGLASISYGLPGALGAQLAVPSEPVVGITGDGGLNMTIGELETARRAEAPVTLLVVNNAASGYVKALQHAMYGNYQSSDLIKGITSDSKDSSCFRMDTKNDRAELREEDRFGGVTFGEALHRSAEPGVGRVVRARSSGIWPA